MKIAGLLLIALLLLPMRASAQFAQNGVDGVWAGASSAVLANASPNNFPIFGTGAPVATTSEGASSIMSPIAATLSSLTCVLTNLAGTPTVAGGTNYVFVVRQNLASSLLTCTIATAASSCTDTNSTHNVSVAINDQIDMLSTPTGAPTALIGHCSVRVAL